MMRNAEADLRKQLPNFRMPFSAPFRASITRNPAHQRNVLGTPKRYIVRKSTLAAAIFTGCLSDRQRCRRAPGDGGRMA